ncbi:MAG TPA: radical SAM/SPASM domain-containing protein [Burkholderiales bacterium]|nr:radical SAM/SPASM domain-containing protein [Burkholderiales bacterium]
MSSTAGHPRITERIERLRTLDGALRSPVPPPPRSAKLELTSRCNYACRFCASHLRHGPQNDMPWPLYTRLARELREAGVDQLGLFYIGESLLYPRIEDAVRFAKRECGYPYVFLTTNGSLATAERVLGLMRAGLDSLKFAFNFADATQFARGAGMPPGTLEAVIRNVIDACDARDAIQAETGKRCLVSASSLSYDDRQPHRITQALEAVLPRLDQHYWLPMYGRASTWAECIPDSTMLATDATVRKDVPCWPLFTEAHVTAGGMLSACGLDHTPRFHTADLNACSFLDAWHGAAFASLRKAHLTGDVSGTACAQCVGYAQAAPELSSIHRSSP